MVLKELIRGSMRGAIRGIVVDGRGLKIMSTSAIVLRSNIKPLRAFNLDDKDNSESEDIAPSISTSSSLSLSCCLTSLFYLLSLSISCFLFLSDLC
jgi:hypothetical protein